MTIPGEVIGMIALIGFFILMWKAGFRITSSSNYRHVVRSRIRSRMQELDQDIDAIASDDKLRPLLEDILTQLDRDVEQSSPD